MGVLIVPILALLIPLSRIRPPLYKWRARPRIFRWYGELRDVENLIDRDARGDTTNPGRVAKQLARLATIDSRVNLLVMPLAYANELYSLKLHIDRVRDKLLVVERDTKQLEAA